MNEAVKYLGRSDFHRGGAFQSKVSSFLRAGSLCVVGLLVHPQGRILLDDAVTSAWSCILASTTMNHPLAEAMVATLGFWWSACLFESLHIMFPWVQRYRLKEEHPSKVTNLIKSPVFFATTKIGASAVYLFAVYLYHLVKFKAPLPASPPTALRLTLEVALGVVLYDLVFMPLHWLMHNGPNWLRRIHRVHHEAQGVLRAGATVRHSLMDGALQVVSGAPPHPPPRLALPRLVSPSSKHLF